MLLAWIALAAFVAAALALDLRGHGGRKMSTRTALGWSLGWTAIGVAFALVVLLVQDGAAASEYLAGFLIEKSLSLDNLFVFAILFGSSRCPTTSAEGARVGHRRRDRAAHDLHPRRRRRARRVPCDDVRARCAAAVHGDQNRPPDRRGDRPRSHARDAHAAARRAAARRSTTTTGSSRAGRQAPGDAAAGGARDGRRLRRDVRDRLDPGDLRDHARHVRRLRRKRVLAARDGLALLPARRRARPLPLPQRRPRRDPRVRRREAAAGRRVAPVDRAVARRDRRLAGGGGDRLGDRRAA